MLMPYLVDNKEAWEILSKGVLTWTLFWGKRKEVTQIYFTVSVTVLQSSIYALILSSHQSQEAVV